MAQENSLALLTSLLHSHQCLITYQPLRTEVAFLELLTPSQSVGVYEIPARASLDPISEAIKVCEQFRALDVAILVPGRKFDTSGTRHGQGGGWYDRFLAGVPREWLRIGFCYNDQLSTAPLKRESWDQAMDYVVVVNRKRGTVAVYSSEGIYD